MSNSNDPQLHKQSQPICRICFEETQTGMIYPCNCDGNSKYVHSSCLKQWIAIRLNSQKNAYCEVCLYSFKIKLIRKIRIVKNSSLEEYDMYKKVLILGIITLLIGFSVLFFNYLYYIKTYCIDAAICIGLSSAPSLLGLGLIIRALCGMFVFSVFDFEIQCKIRLSNTEQR